MSFWFGQLHLRVLWLLLCVSLANPLSPPPSSAPRHPRVVIYRIIGNNVPFLQGPDQNILNTEYIVKNEIDFPGVTRRFVLNRILNASIEAQIVSLLRQRFAPDVGTSANVLRIPFDPQEFRSILNRSKTAPHKRCYIDFSPRVAARRPVQIVINRYSRNHLPVKILKGPMGQWANMYVTNLNPARNFALEDGIRSGFKCIFPFDGNIFIPNDTLVDLVQMCQTQSMGRGRGILAKMARTAVRNGTFVIIDGHAEYQLGFRTPWVSRYNESECFNYGHLNKVEMIDRTCGRELRGCLTIRKRVWRLPNMAMADILVARNPYTRGGLRYYGVQKLIDYAMWLSGINPGWAVEPPFHPVWWAR